MRTFKSWILLVMLFLKILGSVGHPARHTEIKVVDADTNEVLPPGSKGIIKARGPQVMRGYYKVSLLSCISYAHSFIVECLFFV